MYIMLRNRKPVQRDHRPLQDGRLIRKLASASCVLTRLLFCLEVCGRVTNSGFCHTCSPDDMRKRRNAGTYLIRIGLRVRYIALRVQVPNNHIRTQNLYCNYYYPDPKYLIIGYMDRLGYNYLLSGSLAGC